MAKNLTVLFTFCLVLTLNACVTVGQEFTSSRVIEIKIGQTSQQKIGEMFGAPWRVGVENGQTTWTYGFYQYFLFGSDETEDLIVRFDDKGIVRSYNFNTTRK